MAEVQIVVALPSRLARAIDRLGADRPRFVRQAVRREVQRRRREELRRSLAHPHPESAALEPVGFESWAQGLPSEDAGALVDPQAGTSVRWAPGEGWTTPRK
jgi:hypothetical protein